MALATSSLDCPSGMVRTMEDVWEREIATAMTLELQRLRAEVLQMSASQAALREQVRSLTGVLRQGQPWDHSEC